MYYYTRSCRINHHQDKGIKMPEKPVLTEKMESYREAVDKAANWLCSIQNPDGSMNPVEKGPLAYYKVPRGLAMVGRLKEAQAILDWTKETIFTSEGDFVGERKAFHHYHYTYSSAWFVWAAQQLSRFDISYKGMAYLRRFRNPQTGGYCSEATYSAENHNAQDLLSTSFNSFVGLHMGMLKEAGAAAELVRSIIDQQPDPDRMFWLRVDAEGRLITGVNPHCDEPRFSVLEIRAPQQYYYYLGAAMVFLSKLYSVMGDRRHLESAEAVHNICLKCHEDAFLTDGTGKVGLGSAYLYELTAEERYAESAMRSCDFLVADQHPEGYWARGGSPTASSTAEFVVWLTEVAAILGGQG